MLTISNPIAKCAQAHMKQKKNKFLIQKVAISDTVRI